MLTVLCRQNILITKYNKGGPDIGDLYIGSDSLESVRIFFVLFKALKI